MYNQENIFQAIKTRQYRCIICGYIYDPLENHNIDFLTLPSDWVCPECGVGKSKFTQI
ncbi:rubredoxin [bacterium]|nr:rubredoxin [bacterium]MCP5462064.1 rubredoxin [bacterium]